MGLLSYECKPTDLTLFELAGLRRFKLAGEPADFLELMDKDPRGSVFAGLQQAACNSFGMDATVAPPRALHGEIRQGCNGL